MVDSVHVGLVTPRWAIGGKKNNGCSVHVGLVTPRWAIGSRNNNG